MDSHQNPKQIGLIGLGAMGRNHLRVISAIEGLETAFIIDPIASQDKNISSATIYSNLESAPLHLADAFIVAAPTLQHCEIVKKLAHLNKPILVEKPIATTYNEARELNSSLGKRDDIFVGHVERFNPAVTRLKAIIEAGIIGSVIHCSFMRVGGIPRNIEKSGNVIVDLAIHDIDLFTWLFSDSTLVASTQHKFDNGIVHTADILLRSQSGPTASIHCNWITPTKLRQIRITASKGYCVVDLINQNCTFTGGGTFLTPNTPPISFDRFLEYSNSSDTIQFGIIKNEPLRLELEDFMGYLQKKPVQHLCPLANAIKTLALTSPLNS